MAHGGDSENNVSFLEEADCARRLADDHGQGPRGIGDRRGSPVPGSQTFGKSQVGVRRVDDPAGGLDRPIPRHHEGTVELRDFLDRLTDL